MTDRKRYSQKYKDDAVELMISSGRPIAQVAPDIGVNEGTLGTWVCKYREDHPDRFLTEGSHLCLGTSIRRLWRKAKLSCRDLAAAATRCQLWEVDENAWCAVEA
jgi:transposase-like protein